MAKAVSTQLMGIKGTFTLLDKQKEDEEEERKKKKNTFSDGTVYCTTLRFTLMNQPLCL